MNYARIQNSIAQEIIDFDPVGRFHPDVAAMFTVCPDDVTAGSTLHEDGTWTIYVAPPVPTPLPPAAVPPTVSPIEFKLLFTAQERVAIKTARGSDLIVDDFMSIVEDVRLTGVDLSLQSTQNALMYLESKGLLTEARRLEILVGDVK